MKEDERQDFLRVFFEFVLREGEEVARNGGPLERAKTAVGLLGLIEPQCCARCETRIAALRGRCMALVESLEAPPPEEDSQLPLLLEATRGGTHDEVLSVSETHGVGRD